MHTKNLTASTLLCAAIGSLLTFGSALSAQVAPSWSSDFSQYSNNEVLADKTSYSISSYNWRLITNNISNVPDGTRAVAKNTGGFAYASVTAEGNRNSVNARITARNVGSIPVSTTQSTYVGGDIRFDATGAGTATAGAWIMFTGLDAAGSQLQISLGIATGKTFFANFNNITNPSQSATFNAGAEILVDPSVWYTFSAEIAPVTGIANVTVLAGNQEIWSFSTEGNIVPVSFSGVEMQVVRPGSSGLRTADFANITVGTQIPEPATTAALLLLVAFGAVVVAKRRRS